MRSFWNAFRRRQAEPNCDSQGLQTGKIDLNRAMFAPQQDIGAITDTGQANGSGKGCRRDWHIAAGCGQHSA